MGVWVGMWRFRWTCFCGCLGCLPTGKCAGLVGAAPLPAGPLVTSGVVSVLATRLVTSAEPLGEPRPVDVFAVAPLGGLMVNPGPQPIWIPLQYAEENRPPPPNGSNPPNPPPPEFDEDPATALKSVAAAL